MSKEITMIEAKEAKRVLAERIAEMLLKFSEVTGAEVESIDIDRLVTLKGGVQGYHVQVEAKL